MLDFFQILMVKSKFVSASSDLTITVQTSLPM
jgi:hypothetical protein